MASFLDSIGMGNAPNVFTGGLTDQPDWTPAMLDPGTQSIINQQYQQAQMTPQQLEAMQLQGTSPTMGAPATGGAVAQQQNALGGSDNQAVSQALNDRANRLYSSQFNQLQNQAAANVPGLQGRLTNQGANAEQQAQNVNDQLNQMQMQVTAHKNAMRNQVIGQILGGAGSFAGTYAGMQGGRGANPMNGLNAAQESPGNPSNPGNYQSDYNQPYNLTGDPNYMNTPNYLSGVGQDGNGYLGEPAPGMPDSMYGMPGGYGPNQNGYGLGVSFNGSG